MFKLPLVSLLDCIVPIFRHFERPIDSQVFRPPSQSLALYRRCPNLPVVLPLLRLRQLLLSLRCHVSRSFRGVRVAPPRFTHT